MKNHACTSLFIINVVENWIVHWYNMCVEQSKIGGFLHCYSEAEDSTESTHRGWSQQWGQQYCVLVTGNLSIVVCVSDRVMQLQCVIYITSCTQLQKESLFQTGFPNMRMYCKSLHECYRLKWRNCSCFVETRWCYAAGSGDRRSASSSQMTHVATSVCAWTGSPATTCACVSVMSSGVRRWWQSFTAGSLNTFI